MSQSQGVTKLKELLFENESKALSDLQRRIEVVASHGTDQRAALSRDLDRLEAAEVTFRNEVKKQLDAVFSRAGTQDRFRSSVAEVLDRALTEAEVSRHEELSQAVAPLVVRTIKREIHDSQDELVEALYPITGRMVQAYVASAIRDLTERINRQLSANPTMLRFKSLLTGRSMAELALAQSQHLEVEELYLIRRGSGELLARWPNVGTGRDRDQVMSGILTAINEFALEAFADEGSALRQIDLNTSQVYLRASPRLLLAAKCTGVSNAAIERMIDEEFIAALERHHPEWEELADSPSPQTRHSDLLSDVAERIEKRVCDLRRKVENDNSGWIVLKTMVWLVALVLTAGLAWYGYRHVKTEWVRDRANAVIAETQSMRGYPVRLSVSDYGTEVSLAGLAPTAAAKSEIISALKSRLSGAIVNEDITVIPTTPDATPQITKVRDDLHALQQRLEQEAVQRSTARAIRRLAALPPELKQLEQSIKPVDNREIVVAAGQTAAAVRSELESLQQEAAASSTGDGSRIANSELASRLAAQRARLSAAGNQLAGLLNPEGIRYSSEASVEETEKGGLIPQAEAIALETEQFATLTVALAQAASVKPPPPAPPTPRQQLVAWIGEHAIFFSAGTRLRNPETADRHLDELATLMKAADATLRVVGFTDEKGGLQQNSPLSQDRADVVKSALVDRGVPQTRLIAVGRLDAKDISTAVGDSSPNRRVEFELTFVGEAQE